MAGSSALAQNRLSSERRRINRLYRFTLTVELEAGHEGYDDPEWVADAAWGALTNEYGIGCVYSEIEAVAPALPDPQ